MPSRFVEPASVAVFSAQERLSAVHAYCAHACEAAMQGRSKAAHGLFQTALLFFERAKTIAAPDDEGSIRGAFNELDASAVVVYAANSFGSGSSKWSASK